jgi:hypothetical protein
MATPLKFSAGLGCLFLSWGLLSQGSNPITLQAFAGEREGAATLSVRRLNTDWTEVRANQAGEYSVTVGQSDRIEVRLPQQENRTYRGSQTVNGETRGLPIGSSLDSAAGIFYWQPAAGFLGRFNLEFTSSDGVVVPVRVIVGPSVRMAIDAPSNGTDVSLPFLIGGWALDLAAGDGSGIDTVHIWAYPAGRGDPIFLGVADHGQRPDVGLTYGKQFSTSGYNLIVNDLPAGNYDVVVYPHSAATDRFDGAQGVRIVVGR